MDTTDRELRESYYHWQIKRGHGDWQSASARCETMREAIELGAEIGPLVREGELVRLVRERHVIERETVVTTPAEYVEDLMPRLHPAVAVA